MGALEYFSILKIPIITSICFFSNGQQHRFSNHFNNVWYNKGQCLTGRPYLVTIAAILTGAIIGSKDFGKT